MMSVNSVCRSVEFGEMAKWLSSLMGVSEYDSMTRYFELYTIGHWFSSNESQWVQVGFRCHNPFEHLDNKTTI